METTTCAVFCALCRSLFDDIKIQNAQGGKLRRNHWSYQTFHESNAALRESLRLGCSLCTALDYDTTSFKRDEVNVKDQDNCVELNFQFLTDLDGGRPNDTSSSNKRNFVLFKVHVDRRLFSLHQAAYAATNAGDHRVLSLVHEWMTRCRDHHVQCPWTQHPPRYPTRVLDVEEDVIRLVESWNHRLFGPYATLSHSWGKTRVKILTKETLPDFQQGFHIYDIPPTFRDAIHVVRRLNVRYLWIDCYCILQSDDGRNEDQQHEIAEMEEIYSNSIINIGADVATSPMDGCFVTRSPIPRIHIDFTSAPTFRADEYLLFDKKPLDAVCSDFSNPHASSVFGRAWCLQERFLCPRMVHFARSGVFWECDQIEFTSDILPFEYIYSRPRLPPFSFGSKIILRHFSSFSDQWRQILNYYTGMELSRPTEDKLAACGGIAKRIANLMGDEYIAGFFRRNLVPSLAWTVRTNIGQRAKRTKTWRAPSWYVSQVQSLMLTIAYRTWRSLGAGLPWMVVYGFRVPLVKQTSAQPLYRLIANRLIHPIHMVL